MNRDLGTAKAAKQEQFDTPAAGRLSVFKYIETVYSTERLPPTLGYQSPTQFEADHAPAQAAKKTGSATVRKSWGVA